jgi:hypothetical protein
MVNGCATGASDNSVLIDAVFEIMKGVLG